jgi:DeoR/GlpR family transcriptional regulator of sugar metabolism
VAACGGARSSAADDCRLAATELNYGNTLMLYSGSTTGFVARALVNHRDLLITNHPPRSPSASPPR